MKNRRVLAVSLLFPLLVSFLFLGGCGRTPESEALKKVREAIQLLIQTGLPTEKALSLLEEGARELKDPFLEETLGLFYIAQQPSPQWEKAKPHLEKSKTKFAPIVLAEIAMRKEQWAEAVKNLNGKDPLSLFLSAYAYLKMGEVGKARENLDKARISEEKIPLPLIFNALGTKQPLPAVNLRYYSLKWIWDNLGEMGEELSEKTGERKALKEISNPLANYSLVEPEYTACLSLLRWGVNEKGRQVVDKGKDEFSEQAKKLGGKTIGGLYRIMRLLEVIVILGVLLVITGIVMSMVGLIKGRENPLWKRGFIIAGIGFGMWIVLMLLFYPLPAGGLVQGYIGRKYNNERVELIRQHWQKLDKSLESLQVR